jgi:hypothetical protein
VEGYRDSSLDSFNAIIDHPQHRLELDILPTLSKKDFNAPKSQLIVSWACTATLSVSSTLEEELNTGSDAMV